MKSKITLMAIFFLACIFGLAFAEIPHLINYQGRLTDKTGKPVEDKSHSITFRIYDCASGGAPLWEETQQVTTQKGIFGRQ